VERTLLPKIEGPTLHLTLLSKQENRFSLLINKHNGVDKATNHRYFVIFLLNAADDLLLPVDAVMLVHVSKGFFVLICRLSLVFFREVVHLFEILPLVS